MDKKRIWFALLFLVSTVFAKPESDPNDIASYSVRVPLVLASDSSLQRLELAADVLVKLQTNDYSDVRVFDATGKLTPLALALVGNKNQTLSQEINLPAYPILGDASTLTNDGVTLRIEERNGKRVVQINTGSTTHAIQTKSLIGVLLDARTITDVVSTIGLDVDIPVAQPISFEVHASKDLRNWRSVAETVLYRSINENTADASGILGKHRMPLKINDIKDHYLRITWQGPSGQTNDIVVRSAVLTTLKNSIKSRISAVITTPPLTNSHELSFALPFATPLAALKIKPQNSNELIPIRVFGRKDRSQAWRVLADTVIYNLVLNGKELSNSSVELQGGSESISYTEIKIEANKKTAGFGIAPEVSAMFEPIQIIFLASGVAPFNFAAGLSEAPSAYMPLVSLVPGYSSDKENTVPLARFDTKISTSTNLPIANATSISNTPPTRSFLLWGILLLGVTALGLMAYALLKQAKNASTKSN
ncbi:MAG TPA: DUF3999 family protein [Burkholderiaceae bacterium]|nr:DUF3999 family protein [Burkholderiaceae bacterium]